MDSPPDNDCDSLSFIPEPEIPSISAINQQITLIRNRIEEIDNRLEVIQSCTQVTFQKLDHLESISIPYGRPSIHPIPAATTYRPPQDAHELAIEALVRHIKELEFELATRQRLPSKPTIQLFPRR